MEAYCYHEGRAPVIISMPHVATHVPEDILSRLTAPARRFPDTDWHVDRLYGFAKDLGAHVLMATHSRYVVDLNRAPGNEPLYPGQFTTGICPATLLDGSPLYLPGTEPNEKEIQERIAGYWRPYHHKLKLAIAEIKENHGRAVVLEAHSIRSRIPILFEGVLPDLNLGTADGKSADPALAEKLFEICKASPYSAVRDERFKGGYITRHYGNPRQGVHAVQLELTQKNYMREDYPFAYDEARAGQLQETLRRFLSAIIQWAK